MPGCPWGLLQIHLPSPTLPIAFLPTYKAFSSVITTPYTASYFSDLLSPFVTHPLFVWNLRWQSNFCPYRTTLSRWAKIFFKYIKTNKFFKIREKLGQLRKKESFNVDRKKHHILLTSVVNIYIIKAMKTLWMNEAKKVSCNKWEDDKRIRGLIGYMIFFFTWSSAIPKISDSRNNIYT